MATPDISFGVFILFLVFPVATFIALAKIKQWTIGKYILFSILGLFGFIMLAGLALIMFAGYDVTISNVKAGYAETEIQKDANGTTIGTVETTIPEHTEITPVINSFHTIWGWIFFSLAIIFGLLTVYIMLTGGGGLNN
jgi:hypothetical protein